MKKIIIFILSFIFLAISCSTPRIMTNSLKGVYNQYQLDSICNVELLPVDLDKWHYSDIYDYETHEKFKQYVFIKESNKKNEVIYIITVDDSTYYFTKRVVNTIQK